jgi:hypothetical protein
MAEIAARPLADEDRSDAEVFRARDPQSDVEGERYLVHTSPSQM